MAMRDEQNAFFAPGAIISAWDPGETTGICVGKIREDLATSRIYFDVLYSDIISWTDHYKRTAELLDWYRPDIIVIEGFWLYEGKAKAQVGNTFPSVEVIGVIRARAFDRGLLNRIITQPAALASGVQIKQEHESLLYSLGTSELREHAKDAYRHLRYYTVQQVHRRSL